MSSLEAVWEQREAVVYPELFGRASRGIFPLSFDLFAEVFGQSEVDPRWLHHGVFEFAPSPQRATWLYATSGTSNPWEQEPCEYQPNQFSGIGTELVLEVPAQSEWAISCVQKLLAYNILLAHGRFGEAEPLDYGSRVPLGGPINGDPGSCIRFIVVAKPRNFPASFQLASGRVDLLQLVGVSESERELAKAEGNDALIDLLVQRARFPLTDPERRPVA
jgi:hypothetical protein